MNLFRFVTIGIICLILCSCGDDRDEPKQSNNDDMGRVTVLHENGYLANYVVIDATYQAVIYDYSGTRYVQDGKGGSFHAQMYDSNDEDDYSLVQSWEFQTEDQLNVGNKIRLSRLLYYTNYSDLNSINYASDESEGEVKVTQKTDKYITLSFNEFKFTYYFVHNFEERSRDVIVNGEISFNL